MRLLSHISTKKHFLAKLTLIRLGFLRVVFSFLGGVGIVFLRRTNLISIWLYTIVKQPI